MHSQDATRRRHSTELKDEVLAACAEPGASVAAVAQAHGLNANLVHKWRRGHNARPSSTPDVRAPQALGLSLPPAAPPAAPAAAPSVTGRLTPPTAAPATASTLPEVATAFVPVRLETPRAAPANIRLELHRGRTTVIVTWPAQEAAACGSWLREWLG